LYLYGFAMARNKTDVPTTRAICFGCNKGVIATGKAVAVDDVTASPTNATPAPTSPTVNQKHASFRANIRARLSVYAIAMHLLPELAFVGHLT
jgi:hypothetical protein